jgi:hypothetical protein
MVNHVLVVACFLHELCAILTGVGFNVHVLAVALTHTVQALNE